MIPYLRHLVRRNKARREIEARWRTVARFRDPLARETLYEQKTLVREMRFYAEYPEVGDGYIRRDTPEPVTRWWRLCAFFAVLLVISAFLNEDRPTRAVLGLLVIATALRATRIR